MLRSPTDDLGHISRNAITPAVVGEGGTVFSAFPNHHCP